MLRLLLSIALPLLALAPIAHGDRAASPDKKLEEAIAAFRHAAQSEDSEARTIALGVLLEFQHADVAAVLESEYAAASATLRAARDQGHVLAVEIEHKRAQVARLELRPDKGRKLQEDIRALKKEVRELEDRLRSSRRRAQERELWCAELAQATRELFDTLGSGARRKAEKAFWQDAREHPDLAVRVGAIEVLGTIGGDDVADDLLELMARTEAERLKVRKALPRVEAEVRALEARLQEEADEGRENGPSYQQYQTKSRDASALYGQLVQLSHVVDAAAEAAGACIARLPADEQQKLVTTVVRRLGKAKQGLNLKDLDVLRHARSEHVATTLHELLAVEKDPLTRAELIDALAARADAALEALLVERYLSDENWHVRSRAASALATLRSRAGIPALIDVLEAAEGRLRTDVANALTSLTGQNFSGRSDLWRRWWEEHREGFEVPAEPPVPAGTRSVEERVGTTFFGIRTESRRVLFVLDLSGSMNFTLDERSDSGRRPRGEGETRLDVAKRELIKALGGVRDGGLFNLVMYGSDVWSWEDEAVAMDPDTRSEIAGFVNDLTAVGGTNLFRALQYAFDLAGVDEEGSWSEPEFDTLYVLSDGRPSVGAVTAPAGILHYVAERNRNAGIVIHTIGLSGEQDAYLLRGLAEQNGGQYAAR